MFFTIFAISRVISYIIESEIDTFINQFSKASTNFKALNKKKFLSQEFQNIVDNANILINEIQKRQKDLELLNATLEDKVQQKTKKLQNLIKAQDEFIKKAIHEINTPFFDEIAKANRLFFVLNIQDELYINFNEVLLGRVVDNNLSNAVKYSFKDSPIFIKLVEMDTIISFEVKTNSELIKDEKRVFEDFYRENSSRGGFGLGLKIVKEICDENSILVSIASNIDTTTFKYKFIQYQQL